MRVITKTIWILSFVSLFTDIASEMLYPVMPIYLKSIGFSVVIIGVLEGFAEAVAGLSKGYFGKMSDNIGVRLPFVRWGYFLSAVSKPMMAMSVLPAWIFSARTLDRIGKGIRTGARDAMLSDEATPTTKGTVFGFHRSMDTLGAVIGPLSALIFLYCYPGRYAALFYIAFIPGVLAISFTFLLKSKSPGPLQKATKTRFLDFVKYWKQSPLLYRKLVIGLLAFTLFNSSDVFLLLKIKDSGFSDTVTISVYIFYNLIYAVFAYPVGILADRFGLKNVLLFGFVVFAIVYAGMALNANLYLFFALFFLYGVYAAATEGVAKAWITNIADKKDAATAIGTFTSFQSICTMLASSITGVLWYKFGAVAAFLSTSAVTVVVLLYLLTINGRDRAGQIK